MNCVSNCHSFLLFSISMSHISCSCLQNSLLNKATILLSQGSSSESGSAFPLPLLFQESSSLLVESDYCLFLCFLLALDWLEVMAGLTWVWHLIWLIMFQSSSSWRSSFSRNLRMERINWQKKIHLCSKKLEKKTLIWSKGITEAKRPNIHSEAYISTFKLCSHYFIDINMMMNITKWENRLFRFSIISISIIYECLYSPGNPFRYISLTSQSSSNAMNNQNAITSDAWYISDPTMKFMPCTQSKLHLNIKYIFQSLPTYLSQFANAVRTLLSF